MLKAGHQAQVQALDLLLRISADGDAPPPEPAAQPDRTAPAPAPRRRGAGELLDEVLAILPRLPERFTKDDVGQALAASPDRASLFRALRELEDAGYLRVERYGRGRVPTVYRRGTSAEGPRNAADAT
jgi:hypothetical protein